jgi:hypothetical protein
MDVEGRNTPFRIVQSPAASFRCPPRFVYSDCNPAVQPPKTPLQVRERRILQTSRKQLQRSKLPSNPKEQIIKAIFGQFRNTHARYALETADTPLLKAKRNLSEGSAAAANLFNRLIMTSICFKIHSET